MLSKSRELFTVINNGRNRRKRIIATIIQNNNNITNRELRKQVFKKNSTSLVFLMIGGIPLRHYQMS